MKNFLHVAIAATVAICLSVLGGCQLSQTGSSTHAGSSSGKIEKRVSRTKIEPVNAYHLEDSQEYYAWLATLKPVGGENRNFGRLPGADIERGEGYVPVKPAKKTAKPRQQKSRKKVENRGEKTVRKVRKSRRSIVRRTVRKLKFKGRKTTRKTYAKRKTDTKRKKRYAGRKSSRRYDSLIRQHARANGVPYSLARAVVQVESGFRANARGSVGEVGLMQLRPRTARGIGYRGSTRGLYNPATNIKYGMRYLGKAYRLGGRTTCGAILKYNAGHGAKRMNPISRRYCNKVRRILRGKV